MAATGAAAARGAHGCRDLIAFYAADGTTNPSYEARAGPGPRLSVVQVEPAPSTVTAPQAASPAPISEDRATVLAAALAAGKGHQQRGGHLRIGRGGGRVTGFEGLPELRLDLVKQQIDALLQALVLQHQRIADHDAAHAGVFFGKLQQQRHDARGLVGAHGLAVGDLTDQADHGLVHKVDQAFKHLGLAGEVPVQGGFAHTNFGGQAGGGDALCAGLFQHGGQCLQNLQTALARAWALARRCGLFV